MATFPSGLFSWTTLVDNSDDILAAHPNSLAAEIIALETKVGVDSSAVTTTVDYKLRNLPAQGSTTKVVSLNADLLDGIDSTAFFPAQSGDLLLTSVVAARTGWTDVSATYSGYFIRISSGTALNTGGADTHTHGAGSYSMPAHSHGGATGGVSFGGGGSLTAGVLDTAHTHSISTESATTITGTSAAGDNVPVYVQCKLYKRD